jgi:23S rRNA pseudouridine2605 synthase
VRLNRFLALAGISSRRGAEEYVRKGHVTINGELITDLARRISPSDRVRVDGRVVQPKEFVYLLLNKPADFITTRSDEGSRKTIYSLLPEGLPRLAHVGRLDKDSEGLLLLTNDGDLAFQITHPKFKLEKEYLVTLDREFQIEDAPKTKKGVYLSEGRARFDAIFKVNRQQVRVILTQGLKRQVRRVFAALDYKVRRLERVRIGPLTDRRLRPGEIRFLTRKEIDLLTRRVQTAPYLKEKRLQETGAEKSPSSAQHRSLRK